MAGESYREAALGVARWLAHVATPQPNGGVAWPTQPDVSPEVTWSLGWGTLGAPLFLLDAHATTGDTTCRDLVEESVPALRYALGDAPAPGLFTGLAGFGVVFDHLSALTGAAARDDVAAVVRRLLDTATPDGDGVHWLATTEVLWGTAGIAAFLLSVAEVDAPATLELATRAGRWLLTQGEPVAGGMCWSLGDGVTRDRPFVANVRFPNFAHGTAGIAAVLAKLGRVTGDDRFIAAAVAGAEWILTVSDTAEGRCQAWHHDPSNPDYRPELGPARDPADDSPMYTLGWCHGPPGLGWLFRELQAATGDNAWADWVARTAHTVRTSGLPDRSIPGFWDNVGRCCGSAGVVEYFLDLHTWRGDPDDLAFACVVADDLLARAIDDDAGLRWSNVEIRVDPPEIPPTTDFFQGAAGTGLTLLRLARHLDGDRRVVRLPHEADWSGAS